MTKAIFLDRDGTIIKDFGYMFDKTKIEFLPDSIEGLRQFQKNGFLLIIISNQSGVGRKMFTKEQALQFQEEFIRQIEQNGIQITETYFCFHKPEDNCNCRKPKQESLFKAVEKYKIDLSQSYVIGDKEVDILLAKNNEMKSILLSDKETKFKPTFVAKDLMDAYKKIYIQE